MARILILIITANVYITYIGSSTPTPTLDSDTPSSQCRGGSNAIFLYII